MTTGYYCPDCTSENPNDFNGDSVPLCIACYMKRKNKFIAAAQDLLAALKNLAQYYSAEPEFQTGLPWKKAKEAIAKAEGKE